MGLEPTTTRLKAVRSANWATVTISHTGTRTRVGWVKTSYPNHLDYMGKTPSAGLEPATYRLTAERSANWAKKDGVDYRNQRYAWGGIWTHEAFRIRS